MSTASRHAHVRLRSITWREHSTPRRFRSTKNSHHRAVIRRPGAGLYTVSRTAIRRCTNLMKRCACCRKSEILINRVICKRRRAKSNNGVERAYTFRRSGRRDKDRPSRDQLSRLLHVLKKYQIEIDPLLLPLIYWLSDHLQPRSRRLQRILFSK